MIKASFISPKGAWQAKAADTIILDYEGRYRRRIAMTGVRGVEFMLDLPDAVVLRNGDALVLDDGRLVEIVSAPEELAEIRCGDPQELAEVAYHLGNRHVTAQIMANRIRIRRDHVLEEMARGLGAKIAHIEAPFEPDGGAYEKKEKKKAEAEKRGHKHHGHGHDDHDHDHAHKHNPAHGEAGHVHDDHCDHDHGDHKHDHGHHAHGHDDHKHAPAHGEAGHVHDENCDHDHGDAHGHKHDDHKHDDHGHDQHDHKGHKH